MRNKKMRQGHTQVVTVIKWVVRLAWMTYSSDELLRDQVTLPPQLTLGRHHHFMALLQACKGQKERLTNSATTRAESFALSWTDLPEVTDDMLSKLKNDLLRP